MQVNQNKMTTCAHYQNQKCLADVWSSGAPGGEAGGHRAVRNSDQGDETKPDIVAELWSRHQTADTRQPELFFL